MLKSELIEFRLNNKKTWGLKLKTHYKEDYNKILNYLELNDIKFLSLSQALYHYVNDIKEIPKCECGKEIIKFGGNYKWYYPKFCSNKCLSNNDEIKNKKINSLKKLNRSFKKQIEEKIENINKDEKIKILTKEVLFLNIQKILNTHSKIQNFKRIFVINYPEIIKSLLFYFKDIDLNEIIFRILHNFWDEVKCLNCNKKIEFNGNFSKFCSISCSSKFLLKEKRKEIFLKAKNTFEQKDYIILDNIDSFCKRKDGSIIVKCPNNHIWNPLLLNWYKNINCKFCEGNGTSKQEVEIFDFLNNFNLKIDKNNRREISPLEIDIYLPDFKIGIEFNGLYYHKDDGSNKNYHLNKTNLCKEKDIQLIHIFENEWIFKKEIVKSIILSKLGIFKEKYFARKCKIQTVNNKEKSKFLEDNHIQGNCNSFINLGLYFNNELVSLMTFGKRKISSKSQFELLRFCNKINCQVLGGASKLFKFFINNYEYNEIISYADSRFSNGKMYEILGFNLDHISSPNYWYIINGNLKHRINYQKHKLNKILQSFDESLSEFENMKNNGYNRIWDCGNLVYKFQK